MTKAAANEFDLPVAFTRYRVSLLKSRPQHPELNRPVDAYCNFYTKRIPAYANPDVNVRRAVLWHEFVHAALHECSRDDLKGNETLVEGLAHAIMRVRLEVPWL